MVAECNSKQADKLFRRLNLENASLNGFVCFVLEVPQMRARCGSSIEIQHQDNFDISLIIDWSRTFSGEMQTTLASGSILEVESERTI